ncbi:MAG: hypothetical protein QW303_03935, partial [Nitrososphaerota archaeon]
YLYEYVVESHSVYEYIRGTIDLTELTKDNNINFFVFILSCLCIAFAFVNPFASLFSIIILLLVLSILGLISLTTTSMAAIVILFSLGVLLTRRR